MITIADLKEYLDRFDDDIPIVIKADTKRELYDDADLLDPRTACGDPVRIRLGDKTYRITQINIFEATGEVEIECKGD